MKTITFLHLDRIRPDRKLMRLLPPEIAIHYHALPVASDSRGVTIAMASPEDTTASSAVASAIKGPSCLVKADSNKIDQRLAEIWQENSASPLRILLLSPQETVISTLPSYAQDLADLLNADLDQVSIPWQGRNSVAEFVRAAEQFHPDLIVFQPPAAQLIKRVLLETKIRKLIDRLPVSVIIPNAMRWPLSKILLVLPDGDTKNESAIDWTIKFARSSDAAVTVLPLLPPVPVMYGQLIQHNVQSLCKARDPLGREMRWVAQRFSDDEINGVFKLRDGEPLEQLRHEIFSSDPDLVIIAADTQNCLLGCLFQELVSPLLACTNRTVLISINSEVRL